MACVDGRRDATAGDSARDVWYHNYYSYVHSIKNLNTATGIEYELRSKPFFVSKKTIVKPNLFIHDAYKLTVV